MICQHCASSGTTRVMESRLTVYELLRRRRKCSVCDKSFTTYEVPRSMVRMSNLDSHRSGLAKKRKTAQLERAIAKKPNLTSGQLSALLKVPSATIRDARRRLTRNQPKENT